MDILNQLKIQLTRFDTDAAEAKKELLKSIVSSTFYRSKDLIACHELLLFMAAYPQDKSLLVLTQKALQHISQEAARIANGKNQREAELLIRTGISGTETRANFSLTLCKHLLKEYPQAVQLYSCEGDETWSRELLRYSLPVAESDQLNDAAVTLESWLINQQELTGINALQLLVDLLDGIDMSETIREQVFEALRVFVSITLHTTLPSRTFLRAPAGLTHFQRKAPDKKTDTLSLINEPLSKPLKLSDKEKHDLICAARASLMLLNRETDTITYTQLQSVEYYEAGRGIRVALFELQPSRRLPYETYAGYMAFKNGVPVAYGGAWPFGYTAKIGLNIYEPFRGGESAYLFCQLMRVYRQRFGVKEFVVEPYQMGHGNKEGLLSGAFWFYYRMGFRPTEEKTALLAHAEYERIQSQKGYRTPVTVMKKLVSCNAALIIEALPQYALTQFHLGWLSTCVSNYINTAFNGNRTKALHTCSSNMRKQLQVDNHTWNKKSVQEQYSFIQLSLIFHQLNTINEWPKTDLERLRNFMFTKGASSEYSCVKWLQQNKTLQTELACLVNG